MDLNQLDKNGQNKQRTLNFSKISLLNKIINKINLKKKMFFVMNIFIDTGIIIYINFRTIVTKI